MKQYGHFEDVTREFVITDPATPWPWINYLGTEDFFSLISNTAGGYCQPTIIDSFFRKNTLAITDGGRTKAMLLVVTANPCGRLVHITVLISM